MIVRVISSAALVKPSGCGIDEPCAVQLLDALGNRNLREWLCAQLAPAFVVDDLPHDISVCDLSNLRNHVVLVLTQVTMLV